MHRRRAAQGLSGGDGHFPLIIQNVHRYFLYVALVFILILAFDVWKALWFANPQPVKAR